MKNFGRHDIEGFTQVGDVNGKKFGVWVAVINGYRCNITLGEESGRFWIQADNVLNGNRTTPERAAKALKNWVSSLEPGPYNIPIT